MKSKEVINKFILDAIYQINELNTIQYDYSKGTDTINDSLDANVRQVIDCLIPLGYNEKNIVSSINFDKISKIYTSSLEIIEDRNQTNNKDYYLLKNRDLIGKEEFKSFYISVTQKLTGLRSKLNDQSRKGILLNSIEKYFDNLLELLNIFNITDSENSFETFTKNCLKVKNSFEINIFLKVILKIVDKELKICLKITDYCNHLGEKSVMHILTYKFHDSVLISSQNSKNPNSPKIYFKNERELENFIEKYDEFYKYIKFNSFSFWDNLFKDFNKIEQQILIIILSLLKPVSLFSLYSDKYFKNSTFLNFKILSKKKLIYKNEEIVMKINDIYADSEVIKEIYENYLKKRNYILNSYEEFCKIFHHNPSPVFWSPNIEILISFLYVLLQNDIIYIYKDPKTPTNPNKKAQIRKILNSGCFFVKSDGKPYRNFSSELSECYKKIIEKPSSIVINMNKFVSDNIKPLKRTNFYKRLELPNIDDNYFKCSYIFGKIMEQT